MVGRAGAGNSQHGRPGNGGGKVRKIRTSTGSTAGEARLVVVSFLLKHDSRSKQNVRRDMRQSGGKQTAHSGAQEPNGSSWLQAQAYQRLLALTDPFTCVS